MFKVPKTVMGLGGPIRVKLTKGLKLKGEKLHGLWHPQERLIELNTNNDDRSMEATFYHELMHAALDDSGQWNLLTKDGAEALCDLVATMRMREQDK